MIFAVAATEPTVFLLVTDKDIDNIRTGRSVFVDERATKGATFTKISIGYAPTNEAAVSMLQKYGGTAIGQPLAGHDPKDDEARCKRCQGVIKSYLLFEEYCTPCWSQRAKIAEFAVREQEKR